MKSKNLYLIFKIIAAIILIHIIMYYFLCYIHSKDIKEMDYFAEKKDSFEKVTELLMANIHNDDKIHFFPCDIDGVLLYEDDKKLIESGHLIGKQLSVGSDILKDIVGLSPRVFDGITVCAQQVVFNYSCGAEYLVYHQGTKLTKKEFCKWKGIEKRKTDMYNFGDGWYYFRLRIR